MLTLVNPAVTVTATATATATATVIVTVKPAALGNVLYSAMGAAKQHVESSAHVTAVS